MVRYFMAKRYLVVVRQFSAYKIVKVIRLLKIAPKDSGRFFYDNYNLLL